jgi:ATP dependent DNA ligase-like protein
MLATLTDERFSRQGWLFEPKLDGERCLVFGRRGTLRLLSRNQMRLNEKYPEIVEAFRSQPTTVFIADGEVVTFEAGVISFAKLQERMQVANPSPDLAVFTDRKARAKPPMNLLARWHRAAKELTKEVVALKELCKVWRLKASLRCDVHDDGILSLRNGPKQRRIDDVAARASSGARLRK